MKNLRKNMQFMLLFAITTAHYMQAINEIEDSEDVSLLESGRKTIASPLHTIVLDQNLSTEAKLQQMQDILENGSIDINMLNPDGKTALNLATFYSADPAIIQFLIDHHAKVNEPDRFNETPLHNAIAKEQIQVAKMLLAAHANPDLKNDKLETPIDLARSSDTKALFGLVEENQ